MVLETRDLQVDFPILRRLLTALDGFSLIIKRCEFLDIVGENGAVSQCTSKMALGLLELQAAFLECSCICLGQPHGNPDETAMEKVRGHLIDVILIKETEGPSSALATRHWKRSRLSTIM